MACVVTYFFRRRSLALGIAATGSSIGGVVFPVMVEKLIPEVGFGWTMRICAFMVLGLMILGNLTLKSRIPPVAKPVHAMDFVRPFLEGNFALLALGSFLTFLGESLTVFFSRRTVAHNPTGLFLPFTFIILAARERGVPDSLAKYLVAILNAASTFGRTIPPFLADRFGRFTVFLAMALLSCVIVLALWLPSSGTAATVVFALVFGFSSGAVASILPSLVATISHISQIGVRTGCNFSVVAVGVLIGSPIGGQLIQNDGYKSMQGFSGALLGGGFLVYTALWVRLGGLKGKRV
jgi:Na+/melibiose symporter-like transporter